MPGGAGAVDSGGSGASQIVAGTGGSSASGGSLGGNTGTGAGASGGAGIEAAPGGLADSGGAGADEGGAGGQVGGWGTDGMPGGSGGLDDTGGAGDLLGGSGGLEDRGGAGGGDSGPFTCNQVTGGTLTKEFFSAGLESMLDDSRWQLKWQDGGFVDAWAEPESAFWDAAIESPCASGTASPDRVVFMIFSWSIHEQDEWRSNIMQAVESFKSKYPGLRRLDFMTQIRGPNNGLCPTQPTPGETIVVSPELQAAMMEVAAEYPGLVFLAPGWEARSCDDMRGGGPHLTAQGNAAAAQAAAAFLAEIQ